MNNIDVALIAGASSLIAASITGFTAWVTNRQKNDIDRSESLFDAYHDVVANLQSEIARLQNELGLIRAEMYKCEQSNKSLSLEIKKLQNCVDKLNQTESDIHAALSIEHQPEVDE